MRFLALILISLFSVCTAWAQPAELENPPQVFQIVEDMPHLADCSDADDVKSCTMQQLSAEINRHLKYPEQAKKEKKEGSAFVQFVVNKEGLMQDISLLKGPGQGMGEEALRVVQLMADELVWEAGKQSGRKVPVQLTLPIRFKLD